MLLLTLLLALPALGVIIYSGARQREEALADSAADSEKLVYGIASELELLIGNIQQLSLTLAHLPDVQRRNATSVNPLLHRLLRRYPHYANIIISDNAGMVWASALPIQPRVSVADRRYIRDAIATGRFSAGEYVVGKASAVPTIHFGYPIKNARGAVTAVIGVGINLRYVNQLLAKARLPSGSTCAIFDHKGTFLFRGTDADRFIGGQDRSDLFKRMREGPDEGIHDQYGNDGVRRIATYRTIRLDADQPPCIYIRGGVPWETALHAANRAMIHNLALFVPFFLITLGLGWFIEKRCIIDRVLALQDASRSLAAGELHTRVGDRVTGGELGELAHTFDDMAHSLSTRDRALQEQRELLEQRVQERTAELGCTISLLQKEIIERELTEKAIRESESLLRTVLDTLPVAVWILDRDGRIIALNPAVKRLLCGEHLEPHEPFEVIRGWWHDTQEPIEPGQWGSSRAIVHGKVSLNEIYDIECFDGSRKTVLNSAMPLWNAAGGIMGAVVVNEDITERLTAEKTLREKDQLLLQQSRQAAMGEMINNIAHQWRQPLNSLGLMIQQLQLFYECGELNKKSLDRSVEKSMEIILHMSQTIDDFRNFFRPEKEKIEFRVHGVVVKVLSLVEDSLMGQQIEIEINAHDDPVIHGYPNEYSQALLNILINARDALAERKTGNPKVTISIHEAGSRSVVSISDNAGGIPEEIVGRIFEPYFTTKGQLNGTGVGLFMSKMIIEKNMNGRLEARNISDGAEFRIEV
jgi:C4-dicarboxylate-specific signal transduction histidine kinase